MADNPDINGENLLSSDAWKAAGDALKNSGIGQAASSAIDAAKNATIGTLGLPSLSATFSSGNWIAIAIGFVLVIAGFLLFAGEEVVGAISDGNVKGAAKAAVAAAV